jgi:hypothetical protein
LKEEKEESRGGKEKFLAAKELLLRGTFFVGLSLNG